MQRHQITIHYCEELIFFHFFLRCRVREFRSALYPSSGIEKEIWNWWENETSALEGWIIRAMHCDRTGFHTSQAHPGECLKLRCLVTVCSFITGKPLNKTYLAGGGSADHLGYMDLTSIRSADKKGRSLLLTWRNTTRTQFLPQNRNLFCSRSCWNYTTMMIYVKFDEFKAYFKKYSVV
jgi:hypothetical protein